MATRKPLVLSDSLKVEELQPGDDIGIVSSQFWPKTLSADLTVPADTTYPTHNLLIADGVTLTVLDTGEVLVL